MSLESREGIPHVLVSTQPLPLPNTVSYSLMQWLVRQLQNEIFQSLRKQEILDLHTTNILYVNLCTLSKNIQIYTHPGNPNICPKHLGVSMKTKIV